MKNILCILFVLLSFSTFAQKHEMKGRVLESGTNAPLPYTNIGIAGTYVGVATDDNGYFTLKVPDNLLNNKLTVSAIGYTNRTFTVREIVDQDYARILLDKEVYGFNDVNVLRKSLLAFRVVGDAIKHTADNYYTTPLGLDYHYLGTRSTAGQADQIREAIVQLTDRSSYAQPSIVNAYQDRNYRFVQVNKNFDSYSFTPASTSFDELLSFDIVRMGSTIFNEGLLRDYDVKIDEVAPYEGDSVWVISYKREHPDVAYTGDYYANKQEGKLYILKSNYALIRHEMHIEASKNNPTDRSLATQGNDQQKVSYQTVCIYQKYNNKYVLSYVNQDKQFTDASGNAVKYTSKAALLNLNERPNLFEGRTYYEDANFNKAYWDKFHANGGM